jgi:hypothetical protein
MKPATPIIHPTRRRNSTSVLCVPIAVKFVDGLDEDTLGDCGVDAPAAEEVVGAGAEVDEGAGCVFGCEV